MQRPENPPEIPRRLRIIINPAAGRRSPLLAPTLETLRELGATCDLVETQKRGDAEALAAEAARSGGWDAVVAAGGDGTVNEVANGLFGSGVPLGILPLGTVNVGALEIGLEIRPEPLARTLAFGIPVPVEAGRMNGRVFLLMAGAGLDGRIVAGVSLVLKRRLGRGAYALETARQVLFRSPPRLRVEVDGQAHTAAWVIVSKSRYYGGKTLLAPQAGWTRPGFTVTLFARQGVWGGVRDFFDAACGGAGTAPGIQFANAQNIQVTGDPAEPVQTDGDPACRLPVTIVPASPPLPILMPPDR